MGRLPRPDIPPGPQRDLVDALHQLHHRAGWPSLRSLAAGAGCSHTTVSAVFSSPRLPSWGILELLVETMDGDAREFHDLWLSASTPSGSAPATASIAGRRAEMAVVRTHTRRSGLLLVSGEAGIGKTRLVSTVLGGSGLTVAVGHCLPLSTSTPFAPIADALQTITVGGSLPDGIVPTPLARLLSTSDEEEPAATPDDGWSRQRLFGAIASFLESLQRPDPVPLLVEDLHWADTSTLDLMESLLARGTKVPMIGTWRSGDPSLVPTTRDWRLRISRMSGVVELELGPLSLEETREQITLLAGKAPEESVLEMIHARTRGQPLFVEQLAGQQSSAETLPTLLADLLDARLGDLEDSSWAVARALGVAARPLEPALLAAVSGLPASDLTPVLHELARRRLLADGAGRQVALSHPLLAEAIRARLVGGEAATVHEQLGDALAGESDPAPDEVARHFAEAGRPERELDFRIRAARVAQRRFAPREELDAWRRVLELWPSDVPEVGDPPVSRGEAYSRALECAVVTAPLDELVRVADEALRQEARADQRTAILRRAGDVTCAVGDTEVGLGLLAEAVRIHARAGPSVGYVDTLEVRSHILNGLGRISEAAADAATALELAELVGDDARRRRMLGEAAGYSVVGGQPEDAMRQLAEARAIDLREDNPVEEVKLASSEVFVLQRLGAPADRVMAAAETGLAAAERWRYDSFLTSHLRFSVCRSLLWDGQVDRAGLVVDHATSGEVSLRHAPAHAARAAVDLCRGHLDAALERCTALEAVTEGYTANTAVHAAIQAEVELWSGRPREAAVRLAEALSFLLSTEDAEDAASVAVLLARAEADRLDLEGASSRERQNAADAVTERVRSAGVDPFGPSSADVATPAWASTMRAEVARVAGSATSEVWSVAAARWDQLTRPHLASYCRWRGAQAALAVGDGSHASRLLTSAVRGSRGHVPLSAAVAATGQAVRT